MTAGKRLFDIALSILLIATLSVPFAIVAILILLVDGYPVFHSSRRARTVEQSFVLWKFRTMAVSPQDSGVTGGDKKNRVTRLGTVLRRRRLDEIPQLWNVLIGDLSFVGPRPPLVEYVERFPKIYSRVLKSRPGVTGLATIVFHSQEEKMLAASESANETDEIYCSKCIPRKAKLDLMYQKNQTLCYDVKLIIVTLARLVKPTRK